jgi:hypothetical protein
MTILIAYHLSGHKCFEYYYFVEIKGYLKDYFPQAPSYERFVNIAQRANLPMMMLMMQMSFMASQDHQSFYVDSTKLAVCDNHRIHQNKVFKGVAKRGKTSMGWFYGMKLHLIINPLGDICGFALTSGNIADNASNVLPFMSKHLQGKIYGDAGYISSTLRDKLAQNGLTLITKIKSNMKNKLISPLDKLMLKKRTLIETVIDLLKSIKNICHTRHRSVANFFNNLMGGLLAYTFSDKKPSLKFYQNLKYNFSLLNN